MDITSVFGLVSFIYFSVIVSICVGHPQCLDSRPPFQAEAPLSFCANHNYSDFGCCTVRDDRKLQAHFTAMESRILSRSQGRRQQWEACKGYMQTFLCQTCSPYAAHLFDAEVSQDRDVIEPRKLPGLCGSYCSKFYQTCQEFMQDYMDEMESGPMERTRINNAKNQADFCSAVSLIDVDYCYPELLTNAILNGNISIEQVTKEGCICVEPITDKKEMLRNPIFLRHAGDGSNRMFVGEQIGLVHIYYPDGTKLPRPFLDIRRKIHTTRFKGDERGMLGMAFHPRYKENGKFYMYYSTSLEPEQYGMGDHKIRIEEMRVSSKDPNRADTSNPKTILEIIQPFWNHNGGEIMFGDDNLMYIFVGDGGKAGDYLRAGQNLTTMLGKVLRVDVDVPPNSAEPYLIPPDNPFADGVQGLPEIYAFGVRNIWRCGKDRGDPITGSGKGRVVCGDVGQSAREELDLLEKGANYGWNLKEGFADYCRSCDRGLPHIKLTEPIHDYPHSVGKSVTGGNFYRGCHSPNLNGFYIYGDFMTGLLFRLLYDEKKKTWDNKELTMCGSDRCTPPLDNTYSTSIISFGEDEDGEVYMLSTDLAKTSAYNGTIYRIVDPSRRVSPAKCRSARPDQPSTTTTTMTTTTVGRPETTKKDTSAGVIPFFNGNRRMENYLKYFKQRHQKSERRRLQQRFRKNQPNRNSNQSQKFHKTRTSTPAGRLSQRGNRNQENKQRLNQDPARRKSNQSTKFPTNNPSPAGRLSFRGINIRRCTRYPDLRCTLNRITPRK